MIGRLVSIAATGAGFALILGGAVIEETRGFWRRWRTPVGVCRGCGNPRPIDVMFRRDGVPFCTSRCADTHPNTYPEEL